MFARFVRSFADAEVPGGCCNSDRVAVIVEPRRHPYLRAVIRNHAAMLGPSWRVRLYTSAANAEWARASVGLGDRLELRVLPVGIDNLDHITYSQLLTSEAFWTELAADGAEHVLIFQADTVLFRPWTEETEGRWLAEYDYIGANYFNPAEVAWYPVGGIQGGLSLRRVSAMLRCVREVGWADIRRERVWCRLPPIADQRMFEDIYFTHAIAMLGLRWPKKEIRKMFSIEAEYYERPFGHHGWNKPYFTERQMEEIVRQSPSAH